MRAVYWLVSPRAGVRRTTASRHRHLLLLPTLAWAFSSAPALAQQIELYRASLHAHTAYSDGDMSGLGGATAQTPTTAAQAAKQAGLNAFAVTDHGEYVTPDKFTSTISQMAAATVPGLSSDPNTFVGLWGFEWSNCAYNAKPEPYGTAGTGHINIYGSSTRCGALNRGSGDDQNKDTIVSVYWNDYINKSPSTYRSLYQWILDHRNSPLGSTIVVQFNHPNLYPGGTLANPTVHWYTDWWRKMEWCPALDPYICLMEVGSRTEPGSSSPTGYYGGAYNEPYFQVALDNGWHVAPTNSEDNHTDHYGSLRTTDNILTDTGVWAISTRNLSRQNAQASLLGALRARRTFAAEDKAPTHAGAISIKFQVTPVGQAIRWMGTRDLTSKDVQNNRCHLEISRAAGLLLQGGSVDVVTNRGAIAKSLPTSGTGVTISGNTATWDFSLEGNDVAAQLRAVNLWVPSNIIFQWAYKPLPDATGTAPLTVAFDASPSGRTERYYYIRVKQSDGTYAFSAPIWLRRPFGVIAGNDGIHPARAIHARAYTWDFGDGTVQTETAASAPDGVYDGLTQHTYSLDGTYYARATVKYLTGWTDTSVVRVYVGSGTPPTLYGDVNNDGQINREDVALVTKIAAGLLPVDAATYARANVFPPAGADTASATVPGGTSRVDMLDAIRLSRFLNGQIKAWP